VSQLLITPDYYKNLFSRWTNDIAMLPDFPTESKEKLVALHFVMLAFADGEEYSEDDIHEGIKDRNLFSIDHVQIRTNMIHNGFLTRIEKESGLFYTTSKEFLNHAQWDNSIPGVT
jgi:hypothetical protein